MSPFADVVARAREALDPQVMVEVTGEPSLKPIAAEPASRVRAALNSLAGITPPSR